MSRTDRYWRDTVYDLDWVSGDTPTTAPPAPVKLYPGAARHEFAGQPLTRLGDLRAALSGGPTAGTPDSLSTLLHYTAGYCRAEIGPTGLSLHRYTASARCLFPAEIYVWLPEGRPEPPGLHYYDPAHHTLVALARGGRDCREVLEHALSADLNGAWCVLVITVRFWKVAYRYGRYAYRLCTQEAGLVTGTALIVAAALGLSGVVRHRFRGEALASWLGLDPADEAPLAVVPLYPAAGRAPLSACRWRHRSRPSMPMVPSGSPLPPPRDDADLGDLADALRRRSSGPEGHFAPSGQQAPASAFWLLSRHGPATHACDITAGHRSPVALMVAVNRVDGVAAGCYALPPGAEPQAVRLGQVAPALYAAAVNPLAMNFATIPFVVSVLVNPAGGDRVYRVLNVEAGITAARVCLLAAAAGLDARIHNIYRALEIARLLGLTGSAVPLFQIAIGPAGPAPVLRLHLRTSVSPPRRGGFGGSSPRTMRA